MSGPRWNRRRLLDALAACYGPGPYEGVDRAAVAAAFGVTERTVARWLAGSSGRVRAPIPPARLAALMLPPANVVEAEQLALVTARENIASLDPADPARLGRRASSIAKEWQRRGWLEVHMVAVLDLPRLRGTRMTLRQVVWTRGTPRTLTDWRRRGRVADHTTVPTRFHAVALTGELLARVGPWRLYPSDTVVELTRTQVFAADAPAVPLAGLALETGLARPL
ncbi:hypothetical protein [Nocardia sp. IFM 10818]